MSWFPNIGWGGWAAILIPPVVVFVLYFLKIRRPTVQVPSTMLWRRTIEEFNANAPWQRLRRQLLMYLQLLALALIALAMLRPGCRGTDLGGDRFVLLIDNSASMSARDVAPSRLDQAKAEAEGIIDNMKPNDVAMVISFSDVASVEQSYTGNKAKLKAVIRSIPQSDLYTNLAEGLKLATGLSNVGQTSDRESQVDIQVAESLEATGFVLSDGGFARLPDVLLGKLNLNYRPIGEARAYRNVGIVHCQVSAAPDLNGPIQLFVRLENFSPSAETVDLSVQLNGELCDARRGITMNAGEASTLILDLTPFVDRSQLPAVVRVSLAPEDDLAKDDEAFAILALSQKIRLAVISADASLLRNALTTAKVAELADVEFQPPEWLATEEYRDGLAAQAWNAIVFDRCVPEQLPSCNTVFFDITPPGGHWSLGSAQFPAPIVFVSRFHPLVSNLTLDDVLILEARPLSGPAGTVSLLESTFGPITAIGPRGDYEDLVLGFGLQRLAEDGSVEALTNWPTRPSFPTFFFNLVVYQVKRFVHQSADPVSPGKPVLLAVPPSADEDLAIERPGGTRITVPSAGGGQASFEDSDALGVYWRINGDDRTPILAVNLANSTESDIRPRESIDVSYQEIGGTRTPRQVRREWWPWLVAAALITILVEWFVFIRRLGE
jgi:hypothetical protein